MTRSASMHGGVAERHAGMSSYSILRLVKLASDGIFAFSIVPLRLAAIVGFFAMSASAVFALYALYARVWLHQSPVGFTAVIWVVTFLSGTILVFLGVMGEYLGRIYEELKARPVYIVDRVVRAGAPSRATGASESRGR